MKYTKTDVKRYLASLGLKSDDTVLIHTSYKSVGEIEGGPNALIDAFCEYLHSGLFIIPTHTWDNVNPQNSTYIVNKTLPCIGLIPQIAAFRSDGVRSLHPTHSIWAHGVESESFIAGEELSETPAPIGGAWWRLGDVQAKILLIGVGLNRNTYIHAVDEIAGLDDRLSPTSFNVTVVDKNGNKTTHGFRSHYNTGSENFGNFERPLHELGALTYDKLCDADVMLIDAAKCRDIILKIYSRTNENPCREPGEIPEHLWR